MGDMTLGQKIRSLRLAKQLTQKELAGDCITRNMLSQIENGSAMPSMKTMEYLADKLQKPIGYFVDGTNETMDITHLLTRLVEMDGATDYEGACKLLEASLTDQPEWTGYPMIVESFLTFHMKAASEQMAIEGYEKAEALLEAILPYEKYLSQGSQIQMCRVYETLAEAKAKLGDFDGAKAYYEKSRLMVCGLNASNEVQALYIRMMEGDDDSLGTLIDQLDTRYFDENNLARFQMIAGTTMMRNGDMDKAIHYLKEAMVYYEQQRESLALYAIYEQLSQCYSQKDDYKMAYDYLQKAQDKR